MSTEIVAKFRLKDGYQPGDVLCSLTRTFQQWPQANPEFHNLKMFRGGRQGAFERFDGPLTQKEVCQKVTGRDDGDLLLSTTSSFRCWRFAPSQPPEPGSIGIWLESWGKIWGDKNYEDQRVGGDAAISVFDCGPFCALIGTVQDPRREEINERVHENLDALSALFLRLIEALEPLSLKVYTDQGLYLPFNAHLAYYRDQAAVLEDLQLIADVWQHGLPAHGIGPLRSKRPEDMATAFHHWRNESQRERLWSELNNLLSRRARPGSVSIKQVLDRGHFDTYQMREGTTLLNYPDFINSFLDRFYLESLAGSEETLSP